MYYNTSYKKDAKMKTTTTATVAQNVFLPFWTLMASIFVWFLFLEGLKKLGLIKEAKSK